MNENIEESAGNSDKITQLIESGDFYRALELLGDESDQSEVALTFLETKAGEEILVESLAEFHGLSIAVAKKLIENKHGRSIAMNPTAFMPDDHNKIGSMLMNEAKGQGVGLKFSRTEGWEISDPLVLEYKNKFPIANTKLNPDSA